jgi:hypothetical protein
MTYHSLSLLELSPSTCRWPVSVLVSLSLDERELWPIAGDSFTEFLRRYALSEGDKYWED